MAGELMVVVLAFLAATVADIYVTQESSQCSGATLAACSTHHLSCPADGQPSKIALSRAASGFKRVGTLPLCSYAFDCSEQDKCCANNAVKFCFETFARRDLASLGQACLTDSSCEFRFQPTRFSRSSCGGWGNQQDPAMSTISYFCIPDSTILNTLAGFRRIYSVPGASVMYKKSFLSSDLSGLTHNGTCTIQSSSGQEILVSLFLYAIINGPQSQSWHLRVEDTRNVMIDVSPFPGAMTVLTEKKPSLLLTPVTLHVSFEYTGVPDVLWVGFEVATITNSIHIGCWPNYDDIEVKTTKPSPAVTTVQSTTERSVLTISETPSTTTTLMANVVSDDDMSNNFTHAASSAHTSKDFGDKTGLIIGTVLGVTLLVSLAAGFLYVVWRRSQNKNHGEERYRRTFASSTVLDDCGYCVPVTARPRCLSEVTNSAWGDASRNDLPAGSGFAKTLSEQQLIGWRLTASASAVAATSGAHCVDAVYENFAADDEHEDDLESGIDNDSFSSDFDDVSRHEQGNYENLPHGDADGDDASKGGCGQAPDEEPVYQELESVAFGQDIAQPPHRKFSGEWVPDGFLGGRARSPSSAAIAAASSTPRQHRKQEPVPAKMNLPSESQNDLADEAACTLADTLSRNSSLYDLGPAPSPPSSQGVENLFSKARRGAQDLKHKVRGLFAKRESFTPGHRGSLEVADIVANGEALEPSVCNQSSLSLSSGGDRNKSSDFDLRSQSGYSVVFKPGGSRSVHQSKRTSKEEAPRASTDVPSSPDETPRKRSVYHLVGPPKESGPTHQPCPAYTLGRQAYFGMPSAETETNLESPNRIPSVVIRELKKLDKFQGKAGPTSRGSANPEDRQSDEELKFAQTKTPGGALRGSQHRNLRLSSTGFEVSNADPPYDSTYAQHETSVRDESYDHVTLESVPVRDEPIYHNFIENSNRHEC